MATNPLDQPDDSARRPPLPKPARRALAVYRARFGAQAEDGPVVVAWAPGRVNLIGEHTDYNDGFVLPVAIDRVVAIAGQRRAGAWAHCYSVHHRAGSAFTLERAALLREEPRRLPLWSRYVRAVFAELAQLAPPDDLPSFRAAIAGDVPVGGGMSSSAAFEVAVATFAARLGWPLLTPLETAQLCQRAEYRGSGAHVGIMDQAVSCLGRPGQAILLDCRSLAYDYIPFDAPDYSLAVFDTQVPHAVAYSGYNERRRQCEEVVARLASSIQREGPDRSITALRDVTLADLDAYEAVLSPLLLRRARHVISENARVQAAASALRAHDLDRLGQLLAASHASLRDDYEVSCMELDAAAEIASQAQGVAGARMMGAGFGGSVLILVRTERLAALSALLGREYPVRAGRVGKLHVLQASGGSGAALLAARP